MYQLLEHADREAVLIVDSLGTWLADQMQQLQSDWSGPDGAETLINRGKSFADAAAASPAEIIVVSEETGWGIVPENAVARVFRDAIGFTNQRLAKLAQRAYLVVCGHAIDLKSALSVGDFE
jgi:adenosylcobinamide kinase/adenosylcobinamide-phosphate guanylyltransferase